MPKRNTVGEKLKHDLGLDDWDNVKVSHVYESRDTFLVFYNSIRPNFPITKTTIETFSNVDFWNNRKKTFSSFSPPLSIENFNGNSRGTFLIYDLAYAEKTSNRRKRESIEGNKPRAVLNEVNLYDLKTKDNVSSTTMKFKKERNKIMGSGSRTIKLIDVIIEENSGDVTFQFLTEVTPYPAHPKDYEYQEVDPERNWKLKRNSSKTYELQLKFLGLLDWIDVYVSGEAITRKEMKEILQVVDVQLSSTSPSWNYQGFAFWNTQIGSSIYNQSITPERWDKIHGDGQAFLDKHLSDLIFNIDFFLNPMSSMLTKKLKDRVII